MGYWDTYGQSSALPISTVPSSTVSIPVIHDSQPNQSIVPPGFIGPVKPPTMTGMPAVPSPVANPISQPAAQGTPAIGQSNTNYWDTYNKVDLGNSTVPAQAYQPSASQNYWDTYNNKSLPPVTGVNGSPVPLDPNRPYDAAPGANLAPGPVDNSATGALEKTLPTTGFAGNFLTPIAKYAVLPLVSGLTEYTKDIADTFAENKISSEQATAPITTVGKQAQSSDRMGSTGVMDKTNAQLIGDSAQAALTLYMPTLVSKLTEAGFAQATTKQVIMLLAAQGAKEGFSYGLPFGVAQALSSGTQDPKEFAKIVAGTTAVSTGLGVLSSSLLPAFKYAHDETLSLQSELAKQGISSQAGFVKNPLSSEPQISSETINSQTKERGFVTSIKENPDTADTIVKNIEGTYQVQTDKVAVAKATNLIITDNEAARTLAMSDQFSKDSVTTGVLLLKDANERYKASLDAGNPDQGALHEAMDLANHLAQKGTTAGQTVQAFSLLGKDVSTPDKALYEANKFLNSHNETVVPGVGGDLAGVSDQIHTEFTKIHNDAIDQIIKETPGLKSREPGSSKVGEPVTDLQKAMAKKDYPPEEVLAQRINTPSDLKKAPDPVKEMINTLYKVAQEVLPKAAKAIPKTNIELIKSALADKDTYKDVWLKAQDIVRERYKDNPKALEQLDKYFGKTLLSGETPHATLPISGKMVSGSLKEEIKSQGVDLGKVVRNQPSVGRKTGEDIISSIEEKTGVSFHDKQQLAASIREKYNEITQAKKEAILKQIFAEKKAVVSKSKIQQIIELTNLGAFDKAELRGKIADKLGLTTLSDQDAKIIIDKANTIQTLPEGKDKAYQSALLLKKIADLTPSNLTDKLVAAWKTGLVTSLRTKEIKAGSEATMQLVTNVKDVVATGVDKLVYLAQKVGKAAGFDIEPTRTKSFSLQGLSEQGKGFKAGLSSAKDYLMTGVGSGEFDAAAYKNGKNDFTDFKETNFGDSKGGQMANVYSRATFRFLGAETKAYQEMGFKGSLFEQARVQALNEGLKGDVFNARVDELYKNPTEGMTTKAINEANTRVFNEDNKLSSSISKFKSGLKNSPIGKALVEFVLPFQKVPVNIGKDALIDWSPAGFVKMLWETVRPETRTQARLVETFSKAVTGSSVMALGAWLASKGMMSGGYPTTKMEQDQWKAEGKVPNALLINGRWYQLGRFAGPTGELLGLGADFNNLSQDNSGIALAQQMAFEGIKKTGDQPFLQGLTGAVAATQQPETTGDKYINRTIGSLVPNLVSTLADSFDKNQKNPTGPWQYIEQNIPGLSKNVPNKIDMFGKPVPNSGNGGLAWLDPFQSSKATPSPIIAEAKAVGANLSAADQTVFNTKLDNKDFAIYQVIQGVYLKATLEAMIASDEYQNLAPSDKKAAFEKQVTDIRQQVDPVIFPILMIRKYNLSANTDPDALNNLMSTLGKSKEFNNLSDDKKGKVIKSLLNAK